MGILKIQKRREPIVKSLPIPTSESQLLRYRRLQNALDKMPEYQELHDLARERLDELLDEVEAELDLAKSS
jgi:hypothetical protein